MRCRDRSTESALAVPAVLAVLAAALPVPAFGQYFGRNKVQYERFEYQVLKTEHFDIYYYPEEEKTIRLAGQMAERWYKRFERLLEPRACAGGRP